MDGKGFIGFDHIQILDRQSRFLECSQGRRHGSNPHVCRFHATVSVAHQPSHGLEVAGLGLLAVHQDQSGRRIVDPRGVARRHRAVFFDEHGFELGEVLGLGVHAKVFVVGPLYGALSGFEGDGDDLMVEIALGDGVLSALVALQSQRILLLPSDAPLFSDIFRGHPHVDVFKGVVQGADHHVNELHVAHALTKALGVVEKRCTGHVFRTPCNGNAGVGELNGLRGAHQRLKARATQTVDIEGGDTIVATGLDGGHAREIKVARFGIDDVSHHHLVHITGQDPRTVYGLFDHGGGHHAWWGVLQTSPKGANGRSDCTHDDDFTHIQILYGGSQNLSLSLKSNPIEGPGRSRSTPSRAVFATLLS